MLVRLSFIAFCTVWCTGWPAADEAHAAAATRARTSPSRLHSAATGYGPVDQMRIGNASGNPLSNWPLQFGRPFVDGEILGFPQVLINGVAVPTEANVKNRYPDGSVEFAVIAVIVPSLPANGSLTLTFRNQSSGNNAPLTAAQMLGTSYNFDAVLTLTGTNGVVRHVDARAMLQAGDYKVWTQGPIAQTIILGDDVGGKYDIGFDAHKPLRPRFYATFWPASHQVEIHAVIENDNVAQLEDVGYKLAVTAGLAAPKLVYSVDLSGDAASHGKLSWTMTAAVPPPFWLGATPSSQVNIDSNLGWLEATRFFPNYDTAIQVPQTAISAEYAQWTGRPHDLYDGQWDGGVWQNRISTGGERPEIGPYPLWEVLWLYTGDWRMREMSLGLARLAGAFPGNLRESVAGKRLSRSDPPGSSSGLGHEISIAGRPSFVSSELAYGYTKPADRAVFVGAHNSAGPWSFDDAHQPDPFYPAYILTGDPWWLEEMYLWAGFTAAMTNGVGVSYPYGRGPTGAEGGIAEQLRAAGWAIRSRVETAFAAPATAAEKGWFRVLANDALARWEGGFGITGTVFDGSPEKVWGAGEGNFYSWHNDAKDSGSAKPPPLHNWESNCDAASAVPCSTVVNNERAGIYRTGAVGSYTAPWMQYFVLYGLGRAAELGFAAGPLLSWSGQWLTGMINTSGKPILLTMYQMPVEKRGGGFLTSWAALLGVLQPSYVSTTLPSLMAQYLRNPDAYPQWAIPAVAYLYPGPGGTQAWSWMQHNVYAPTTGFAGDPKWAILPYTGSRTLPRQSPATPR